MPNRNMHEVMGHLGKDPEPRMTPTGKHVCRINVATSNDFFDKQAQKWIEQDPEWHNVIVWGELAEKVAREFSKGDAIMVRGRSKTREYQDKDGQKKRITEITANEVYKPIYVSKRKDKTSDDENLPLEVVEEVQFEDERQGNVDLPF